VVGPFYLNDIGKHSFVNRAIKRWNQLPAERRAIFTCEHKIFRNRVTESNCKRGEVERNRSVAKIVWKCREMK